MEEVKVIRHLVTAGQSKIVLLVLDGLGGLPHPDTGLTELETARTPNLDRLAKESICGLIHPIAPGITPGSGPAHLALFGYDPFEYEIGRGILSAMGIGIELLPGDVAARVNYCSVREGKVVDRRAGRISTEQNSKLCELISSRVRLDGMDYILRPEKEHRAALVLRGKNLSSRISDSDPQKVGLPPLEVRAEDPDDQQARKTAALVNLFLERVGEVLADQYPANMILVRGFSSHPQIPSLKEIFGINPAAIATYPMYRGLARLVGMEILETGDSFGEQLDVLEAKWEDYDYFYVHYKKTDSYGEDGDFIGKVKCIEEVDNQLERILQLKPDVLVVTGDHSTPALLRSHSWHPSPLILHSKYENKDKVEVYSEVDCQRGGLGIFNAVHLMGLMLANAQRLNKFGA
jgi:2,3-bisphosphoglycerate-independent phosphoglycerate mutase